MGTGLPFLLLNNSNWANHILDHMNWQSKMQSCWTNFMYFNMPSDSMNYYLPDPNYAAQSCFQAWNQYQEQLRNNNMQFGGYGNFGGYGGYGGYGSPSQIWGFNPSNSNSSSSSSSNSDDPEVIKKKEQYDVLVPILKNIEKSLPNGSILRAEITAALKKTGKIEEKYEALEKVMEKVTSGDNKDSLRTALLQKYEKDLKKAGFDVTKGNIGKVDAKIKDDVQKLVNYIDRQNGSGAVTSINKDNIISIISTYNDEYPELHLMKRIYEKADKENLTIPIKVIEDLEGALSSYINDLEVKYSDCDFSKLKNKQKELNAQVTKIEKCENSKYPNFSQSEMNKLSDLFDDLYKMVRLTEAELINDKVKKEYEGVNDLLGDVLEDNFIVKNTKEDLKKENCKIDNIEIDQQSNDGSGDGNVGNGDGNAGSGDGNVGSGDGNVGSGDGNVGSGNGNVGSGNGNVGSGNRNVDGGGNNNSDKVSNSDNTAIANAEKLGVDMRSELYINNTSATKVDNYLDKINTPQETIAFIKGYNKQKSIWCQWNSKLCAKIATEDEDGNDKEISKEEKIDMLIKISNKFKKVINELLANPNCSNSDKEKLKEYLENFNIITDEDDKNPEKWQTKIGFWSNMTWSTWGNPLTGVANYMDRTIDKICKIYEKLNKQ